MRVRIFAVHCRAFPRYGLTCSFVATSICDCVFVGPFLSVTLLSLPLSLLGLVASVGQERAFRAQLPI